MIQWLGIAARRVAVVTLGVTLAGCSKPKPTKQDQSYSPNKDGYILNWLVLGLIPLEDFEKGNTAL